MAKELVTRYWCDNGAVHGDEMVEGSTFTVALGGGKPVEVELCSSCAELLLVPLQSLVASAGQPVRSSVASSGKSSSGSSGKSGDESAVELESASGMGPRDLAACAWCGDGKVRSKHTFREHLRSSHARLGDGSLMSESPHKCPLCDEGFMDNRGVGVHLRLRHEVVRGGDDGQEMLPA